MITMQPHFWQSENIPTLSIGQIPLCLAWSLTIHKMQGTTLNMAEIDIGQSIFEYGQSYVALSRVQSLDGLYLSAFHAQKIKANPKVLAFYDSIVKPAPRGDLELGVDFSLFNYKEKEKIVENAPSVKVIKL